jgi:hypothetical protein
MELETHPGQGSNQSMMVADKIYKNEDFGF